MVPNLIRETSAKAREARMSGSSDSAPADRFVDEVPSYPEPVQRNYYSAAEAPDYAPGSSLEDPRMPTKEEQMQEIARLHTMLANNQLPPVDDSYESGGLRTSSTLSSGGYGQGAESAGDESITEQANVDALRDEALYNQSAKSRIYALKELADSPDKNSPEVVSVFNEALVDADPEVRREAIWTAHAGRVPVTTDTLLEVATNDPNAEIRGGAYVALVDRAEGDDAEVRRILNIALQDPESAIQETAQHRLTLLDSQQ